MMIGIRAIASHVPSDALSNYERRDEFGLTDDFIVGKLGVERVSRKRSGDDTSDLCLKALAALQSKVVADPAGIDCLIVCTQNPDRHGIPHTSAIIHGAIGAGDGCAAFDISLGCSGYVYSLAVAKSFMEANGLHRGLLFTADPYSKILDPSDKNTVLLFGDAATVTLLDSGSDAAWTPKRFLFSTRGHEGKALNNDTGKLEMNGRAVFNFSATAVPVQIKELLDAEGIDPGVIDLFLFHQGSRYILDTLVKRLGLPPEKVPSNLAAQGNTVSSSIPLLFEPYVDNPGIKRVLMSGFGVGLSWASCLLERGEAIYYDKEH
jgi:3-oxoacyl-[acyl-carrier-protein] synthase III